MIRIPSDKKIEVPIAEIKLANLLAPRMRSLRYATSSTNIASSAQIIIAPNKLANMVTKSVTPTIGLVLTSLFKIVTCMKRTVNVPIINTSEFAKFIKRNTP
jgi:hypothetical protein